MSINLLSTIKNKKMKNNSSVKLYKVLISFLLILNSTVSTAQYCSSSAISSSYEDIVNVTFGTLNNSSTCTTTGGAGSVQSKYSNYTAVSAPIVAQGLSYTFSVEVGTCSVNNGSGVSIFIDYNQNSLFTDPGETVYTSPSSVNGPHLVSGSILIPTTATLGTTRMRVVNVETGTPSTISSCGTYGWGETEDYSVNIISNIACSGTPAPGNTLSNANPACSGVNFTLSVSNSFPFLGISYQWQSSPNNIIYTNIAGATSPTLTTSQTAATYYRLAVTCSNSSLTGTSTPLQVTMNSFINCYCTSSATNAAYEDIFNVTIGTLNNSSTCFTTGGPGSIQSMYSNYTAVTAPNLAQGATAPFVVQIGECTTSTLLNAIKIFIDYNQNGLFTDFGETAFTSFASQLGQHFEVGSIAIPGFAVLGNTRMRIVNRYATNPSTITPCGTYGSGETEDYFVNITPGTPCTGTPAPGATQSTASSVCPSTSFTLSTSTPPSTASNITYQWQSSPNNVTYTNISGATSPSYTTTQSSSTYYQLVVTCNSSSGVGTSTPLQVTMNPLYSCYCSSIPSSNDEEILNVTVSTLNNNSTCGTVAPGPGSAAGRYGNYMTGPGAPAAPNIYQVSPQNFSITIGSCDTANFNSGLAIFIDLNADGDFIDTGEKVYSNGATANIDCVPDTTVTGNFTIPSTSFVGTTAMRIINARGVPGNAITPCMAFTFGEVEDYMVNILAATPCAGTPSPGATTSSPSSVCSTTNFTLGMTTPPVGLLGMTYQWQSSPTGVTYTNIPSATSPTFTTTQSSATWYRVVVTCTNSSLSGTSSPLQVLMNPHTGCYCSSMATTTADEEIKNVTFLTLNNTSDCFTPAPGPGSIVTRYANYMSGTGAPAAPSVPQNASTPFSITVGSCGSTNFTSGLAIFVDLNHNGSFADPGEKVYSNGASSNINCVPATVVSSSFTIPAAMSGITGMRIINSEGFSGNAITPCLSYGFGETEDYLIDIQPPPPIDMMPVTLAYPSSASCHVVNDSVVITVKNNGSALMNFSSTPVTLNSSVSGANPATFTPVVISAGTLAIGATQNITVATGYNTTLPGVYTFNANTSVAGDGLTANDNMPPVSFTVAAVNATVDDDTVCPFQSVQLNVVLPSMASYSYSWSPSAGLNNPSIQNPTAIISGPTTYTVTVTDASGCNLIDSVNVQAYALPVAMLTDTSFCATGAYTLDAQNPGSTYMWSTTETTQSISVSSSGLYYVDITSGLSCSSIRDSMYLTLNPLPIVDLGPDVTQCGGTVLLDAGNSGSSYLWDDASYLQTRSVSATGNYYVEVTGANLCTSTDSVLVTINPIPVVSLGPDVTQCGGTVLLDAGNLGSSYVWDDLSFLQTRSVSSTGNYYVEVTNASGCAATDSVLVTINPVPVVSLGPDVTQCGGSVLIDAGNPGSSYVWDNSTFLQTCSVNATGNYYVTVTDANLCTSTDSVLVTINSDPVVNLGPDVTQCGSVTLDAGNPGFSYLWTDNSYDQTLTVYVSGPFDVVVSDSLTGCTDSDTVNVSVLSQPSVELGPDTTQCGGVITLNAGPGYSSYDWGCGTGCNNQTYIATTSGQYIVMVDNGTICFGYDTINVTLHAVPSVGMVPFPEPLCTQTTSFALNNGTPSGGVYSGTGVSGGMFDPAVAGAGNHIITYTITDSAGCSNTTSQDVQVKNCTGIEDLSQLQDIVVYPNPTSGIFNIVISNANFAELNITITDIQDKIVHDELDKNTSAEYNKQLNLENLGKGIYYIRLMTGTDLTIKKLIIQ